MSVAPPPRIRPGWVWGIFILYILTTTWSVLVQLLMRGGLIEAPAAHNEMMQSMRTVDYVLGFSITAVQLVGVSLLWLLRREAFPVLMFALVLGAANMGRTLTKPSVMSAFASLGVAGVVGAILALLGGLVLSAAVLAYTWTLRQRGVLH